MLEIQYTNPVDPVRNIRFVPKELEARSAAFPFYPSLLHQLRNFKLLRFMDWTLSNVDLNVTWDTRTTNQDRSHVRHTHK